MFLTLVKFNLNKIYLLLYNLMMNIIFVSRNFNRIGFEVLKKLICSSFKPKYLILPSFNDKSDYLSPNKIRNLKKEHEMESKILNQPNIKYFGDIESLAIKNNIEVKVVGSMNTTSFKKFFSNLNVDLMFLGGGWPELINSDIFKIPKYGSLNTHPSLLPKFKGTDVHRWQILENTTESGITIHKINELFDSGEIISQKKIKILPNTTPQKLVEEVSKISGDVALKAIQKIKSGNLQSKIKNFDSENKYYNKWDWSENDRFLIDFNKDLNEIQNFILASTQESYKYNGPFFVFKNKYFILRQTMPMKTSHHKNEYNGFIGIDHEKVFIICGNNSDRLEIIKIQKINIEDWNGQHKSTAMSGIEFYRKFCI